MVSCNGGLNQMRSALNNLAIEQDIYNAKREAEEKDVAVKELSAYILSKNKATSKDLIAIIIVVICYLLVLFVLLSGRFRTSEGQWVEAQVETAKQQAILIALKSQVASDEAHIHMDLHTLSASISGLDPRNDDGLR
ncbi:hypothetical protein Dimus_017972 [Dionaea muscipula]